MTKLTDVSSYIITPLLLVMHWWTGHTAWLYVFGALSVVSIIASGGALVVMLARYFRSDFNGAKLPAAMPKWKTAQGLLYQAGAATYLLWSESYVTVTLFLIGCALLWGVVVLCKVMREEYEQEQHAKAAMSPIALARQAEGR